MGKIQIKLRTPERKVSNIVRIDQEARAVLQEVLDEHDVSATQVVSQLIIQGAPLLEFVRDDG